ncbi:MAG: protein kinase domain-containing protein [Prochlorococcaceae cyanobacterium]|jgi:DNA-binding helix-hairpin-helix protein with protein kinase domain
MNWILPPGLSLPCRELERPLRILRGLGGGSQGQVYEVEVNGERLALKWYLPACLAADPSLPRRLAEAIRATAPNQDYLWPISLLHPTAAAEALVRCRPAGFGTLMDLRPQGYVGVAEHVAGRISISLRNVVRACFFLADAFHALHLRGLCHKDISLGNLFLEPGSGRILICDNDNVDVDGRDPGSVLGTPGFMAPEVLLGQARPGADSDLFSLAVLLFRLLTRSDPLRGRRELAIRCLDEPARRRLYGEDPLFVFDLRNPDNRPDPVEHAAALLTWPIWPPRLQELFQQTFGEGLRQPGRRVLTGQWRTALARTLDGLRLCPACGQEVFAEPAAEAPQAHCWNCGTSLEPPLRLELPHGTVLATPGNELRAHHLDPLREEDLREPLARVEAHPQDPAILGLRNLSGEPWSVELAQGQRVPLEPGKTCNLAPVRRLTTPAGPITVGR